MARKARKENNKIVRRKWRQSESLDGHFTLYVNFLTFGVGQGREGIMREEEREGEGRDDYNYRP